MFGSVTNLWASSTCAVATSAATDPRLDADSGALVDPTGRIHRFPSLEDGALGERLWAETDRILA